MLAFLISGTSSCVCEPYDIDMDVKCIRITVTNNTLSYYDPECTYPHDYMKYVALGIFLFPVVFLPCYLCKREVHPDVQQPTSKV